MSFAFKTTTEFFLRMSLPRSGFYASNSSCSFSDVPLRFKIMFSEFKVRDWKSFNEDASRILTGRADRRLTESQVGMIKNIPPLVQLRPKPEDEIDLLIDLDKTVFTTAQILTGPRIYWKKQRQNKKDRFDLRTPDFSLRKQGPEGSSSKQRSDNQDIPIVTGELKTSNLRLGSSLSAASVTALIRHPHFDTLNKAKPIFQLFSYMLNTKKGVGVVTNLDETRFFKINQKDKELLMSPLVRIDQRLVKSGKGCIPHAVQAYIYADEIPDPTADELSSRTTARLLDEADRKAKEIEKRREEERRREEEKTKKKSSGSDKKKSGAGASSSSKGGKKGKQSDYEIFSPASNILEKCRVIGTVGEGLTGHVTECDFEGLKVAVKTGYSDYRDERDCFVHVQNEIDMYEMLKELQGSVVPRVLAGCLERYYTPSAMVLITEKVGMAVVMKDDKLFVGDKELSREDLVVMKEKGLEGLEKIHGCGIVHSDAEIRNTRVELKEGKVERVWWIDFGDAAAIDYEAGTVWGKDEMGFHLDYERAIALDTETYEGEIDAFLEHAEFTTKTRT